MQKQASVKASRAHAPTRGKLHHVTVTPSDNGGATVEARFNNATPENASMGMDYDSREAALTHKTTHEDPQSALEMVGEHMGVKKAGKGKKESAAPAAK